MLPSIKFMHSKYSKIIGAAYLALGLSSGLATGFCWIDQFLVCFGIALLTAGVIFGKP